MGLPAPLPSLQRICQAPTAPALVSFRQRSGTLAIAFGDRIACPGLGASFSRVRKWAESREILQHDQRIGTVLIEAIHLRERGRVSRAAGSPKDRDQSGGSAIPSIRGPRPPRPGRRRARSPGRAATARRAPIIGGAGDQREGRGVGVDSLRLGDPAIVLDQHFDRDPPQRERWQRDRTVTGTCGPRLSRNTNLTSTGGSERLQQSVEGVLREHVGLRRMM